MPRSTSEQAGNGRQAQMSTGPSTGSNSRTLWLLSRGEEFCPANKEATQGHGLRRGFKGRAGAIQNEDSVAMPAGEVDSVGGHHQQIDQLE